MRDKLLPMLPPGSPRDFLAELAAWDGSYAAGSRGALLFELLLAETALRLYGGPDKKAPMASAQWSYLNGFLMRNLAALDPAARERLLGEALEAALRRSGRYDDWGDLHHVRLQHMLGRVPVIGRLFRYYDRPAGGSRETLFKTSHGLERERHWSTYGSQSRFISDLSDPDLNYFVLFGGQDGYLGSANFADQISLWERREFVRLPLRPETVRAEFPRTTVIRPGG